MNGRSTLRAGIVRQAFVPVYSHEGERYESDAERVASGAFRFQCIRG
jgi:hypothetical protein